MTDQQTAAPAPGEGGDERVHAFPASFAQQRLWFVDQLDPGRATYNIPYHHHTRLRGRLDVAALQQAVTGLVMRHEPLRTTFITIDGEPVQVIRDDVDTTVPIIDLSTLDEAAREEEMQRIVEEESRHSFDLETGPLFYAKLVRLEPEHHVLIAMMSHIVVDGMSLEFIAEELEELYAAALDARAPRLDEVPLQYADFVVWHQDWIDSAGPQKQLEYWKEQLSGRLPVISLPTDRPRPSVQQNNGSWEWVDFPGSLIDPLRDLSRTEGVSLFMTMLAGFATLLHRQSGQDEVLIGTPTANRAQPELERLIAFFVNPVVMRSMLDGDPVFTDFLAQTRSTALGAMANQDVPFERLVTELKPERDLSHNPLFQVSFTLQMAPPLVKLRGLISESVPFDNGTSKFDLLVELWEAGGSVQGRFEYDTDLFDRSTIRRMIDNYAAVLASIAATPSARVGELNMIAPAERARVVDEWNDTARDFSHEATLHQLIEAQVDRAGHAVAVQDADGSLTYAELDARANQLAHHLIAAGVASGDFVGVSLGRSTEMMVALLAVMKSGAAYLPLDPEYPVDRRQFIVADAGAGVLLTEQAVRGHWDFFAGTVITIDDDRTAIDAHPTSRPTVRVSPEQLVYTIHTSGSTGNPKGVKVTHRNVVNFLESMRDTPGLGPDDALMAVTTLSFDIAVLELYLPLIVGARVLVAGPEIQGDGTRMAEVLRDENITVMQATPASWKLLLGSGWEGKADLRVLCGGEELPRDLAERLLPKCQELWNMYGPTETTVWSAVRQVESGEGPVPIGDPIANTQIYVLDKNLAPTPIGVAGELCIAGVGVTAGYLDRDELTADRFVSDPFSTDPDARMYRTGDLCRYRPDGTIEFLGRMDFQVKVRGFRIELGEIETVLARHADVAETVVTASPDASGESRLIAYVLPVAGVAVDTAALRDHLAESLPLYMVPTLFVAMDDWPLTNNGKIDRKALPEPSELGAATSGERVEPRNDTESAIAGIWGELLGLDEIGVTDNLFELGGHSLLAAQIMSRVERAFDVTVALPTLFADPTVAHLAQQVDLARVLSDEPVADDDDVEEFVI